MSQDTIYQQIYWNEVQVEDQIPEVALQVSYKRAILAATACWDFFPGHHDPEYASSQGQKTIYVNTIFFQGFIDRIVTDWAGPQTFISRRKITMKRSLYAEDTAYGRGNVIRVYRDEDGRGKVDLEVTVSNQDHECCSAEVTLVLPTREFV